MAASQADRAWTRATFGAATLAAATFLAAGCASLPTVPAPLAPVRTPPYSALELERHIAEAGTGRAAFADEAMLVSDDDERLSGRTAILDYLTAGPGPQSHAFEFMVREVYRCGPDTGVERGNYRALRRPAGVPFRTVGRWQATWEAAPDGTWRIRDAALLRPGAPYAPVPSGCAETREEVRASARATLSVHGRPFAFFTADPHANAAGLSSYPHKGNTVSGSAALLGARWRIGSWLLAGGYAGLEPRRTSWYRLDQANTHSLESRGAFVALVAGYEGGNVSLDAGPAWLRSTWAWYEGGNSFAEGGAAYSRLGALATVRATVPVSGDVALDLIVQQRWFGDETVPGYGRQAPASRDGLVLGLGFAFRQAK